MDVLSADSRSGLFLTTGRDSREYKLLYHCRQHTHIFIHIQCACVCECVLCMHTISFIKPWENMLPFLLNIDVLSGIKWVNKSWQHWQHNTQRNREHADIWNVWCVNVTTESRSAKNRKIQWKQVRVRVVPSEVVFSNEKYILEVENQKMWPFYSRFWKLLTLMLKLTILFL